MGINLSRLYNYGLWMLQCLGVIKLFKAYQDCFIHSAGASLLIWRSRWPKKRKSTGMGIITTARHPNSVPAHWMPKLLNICRVNNGNTAPTMLRIIVLAAKAEAALYSPSVDSFKMPAQPLTS